MSNTNTLVDRFKSPALWLAVAGVLVYCVIRLDKVDVLERRLQNKIEIIEEQAEAIDDLEHLLKDKELDFIRLHYEQQLEIEKLKR